MQKVFQWAKGHKVAAGAIGCGGLIVVGFVLLIVLGLILTATGAVEVEADPGPEPTVTQEVTPTSEPVESTEPPATPEPEPSTAPAESPTPAAEPEPEEESLAERVEQTAYEQAMIDSFQDMSMDSPAWAVTKIEDVSAGTVRVYVQLDQTDEEAELTARWFMNMTCGELPELDAVVVRDTSGVDRNHFMTMMNPPTVCG